MSSHSQNIPRNPTNNRSPVSSPRKRAQNDVGTSENRRKDPKVSRACDLCKIKKIRCTGTLPCVNCARRRLNCAYATKYARGRPPTPLPLARQDGPTVARVTSTSSISDAGIERDSSGRIDRSVPNEMTTGRLPSSSNEAAPSRASPELEIEGQYFDPTSGLTFLHRAWRKLFAQKGEMAAHGSNEADKHQLLTCAGDRPFYLDEQGTELIPDDMTARTLLSLYFDTCVVTYRIFHRQTVENWLEIFLKDREQNRQISYSLGNAKCAIILTVLAIAGFRNEKLKGGFYSGDNEALALRQNDRLFCVAMNLTDSEMGFPRLESAQARLVQVLYLLQTSRMNKAWYTFGSAYHIFSSLGLHRRRSRKQGVSFKSHSSDYISLQCAKRVFWVAYTIDKYLSVVFGRPRFLHDEDIDQDFPDSINDEDMGPYGPLESEASEECHVDSLIFHAKIARIIGRISREVYAIGDIRTEDRVAAAHRLVGELHEWRTSLPPHLGTIKPSTLMPSFRRESSALNLAYHHAVIHANRPFLLGDGNSSNSDAPYVKDRVAECISAAKVTLELVNNMANDTNLFHSFWWTHYVTFCALAVVYVWEIQRSSNNNNYERDDDDEASYTKLFDLAERCRSHLLRANSAASPSRRYGVILEELRKEAQQQAVRNHGSILFRCTRKHRPLRKVRITLLLIRS
ncbi:C6 transcription factor, putative [Talaromyces stipitatus ATCC 10500]|uniref:C6 transcription factor, putative n=1 Tax=Talaromyces stipitatus (strain ATCC 10500 / CBS 375.48 / QM 6759 / NRRL 1006) TaxID=441959 RepID=B8M4I8_TALSN|nr:C6 transcription factor, putative [Talaromyces stipitatus ATCC 10500]EED19183.1 C6 transcription factor, putative [Talaromyces stipitatus ATCC 10500]